MDGYPLTVRLGCHSAGSTRGFSDQVVLRINPTEMAAGFRRGLDVYHRLGSYDAERRGKSRRYRDDEHWFI